MMLLSRENYEKDMGKTEYILTENKKVKTIHKEEWNNRISLGSFNFNCKKLG